MLRRTGRRVNHAPIPAPRGAGWRHDCPERASSTTASRSRRSASASGGCRREQTREVVSTALDAGYRHVDTATLYRNEEGVGEAVRKSGLDRDAVFVTSKVWNDDQGYDATLRAFDASLDRLGFDVLDLYLIHWPTPDPAQVADTWRAMEKLYLDGRIRAIGVSNFEPADLRRLLDGSGVVPVVNQVELHPYRQRRDVRRVNDELGVATEAWGPLAQGGELLADPAITRLADKHAVSPAQVVLRWHLELGTIVIPKSVTPERIASNIDLFDFELDEDDMAAVAGASDRDCMATKAQARRQQLIIDVLESAFADLMSADPHAFRVKFRKMAADPFAFYRGSACLFYADMTGDGKLGQDAWADERTSRVWIHGDLHAENFGTYMNSHGRMVFDVNDFDEAYIGHFSWDLRRFVASLALLGWQKALPDETIRSLIGKYLRAYLAQVSHYADCRGGRRLRAAPGEHRRPGQRGAHAGPHGQPGDPARRCHPLREERAGLRRGRHHPPPRARRSGARSRRRSPTTSSTIPESKRFDRALFYEVRDVVGKSGFGIGSAGLPAYNVLVEGYSQSLDNDVVLSMKQANVPAVSRFVDSRAVDRYFDHEGHRTVVSQRALQVHTDPLLGYTRLDGTGYVVAEVSPYEFDLDWGEINEPDEMASVVANLGRATAKVHCASDEDSDQSLVKFQTEEAICKVVEGRRREFVDDLTDFGVEYADRVRADHELFVDAFREGRIGGVTAT